MSRIAKLRKQKNMTQIELASELGISQGTLSQYETDRRTPDSRTLIKLSELFGVSTNAILDLPEEASLKIETSALSMTQVTKIMELDDFWSVNNVLDKGWRLLFIGSKSEMHEDGTGYSKTAYTIGWFGDANDAVTPPSLLPRANLL